MKGKHVAIVVVIILIIDQVVKYFIKTNMYLGEEFNVFGDWFRIHFTENPGMAFGMRFGGEMGKYMLSIFRIFAIIFIIWYIRYLLSKNAHRGLVFSMSMILAGAIGNIIDSAFYGMIFTDSYHKIATIFPEGGGYAPFLQGKVVDMLYFPIIKGNFPTWFPSADWWPAFLPSGGEPFIFFSPVFNIADTSITTGVMIILFFQRRFFTPNPIVVEPPRILNSEQNGSISLNTEGRQEEPPPLNQ